MYELINIVFSVGESVISRHRDQGREEGQEEGLEGRAGGKGGRKGAKGEFKCLDEEHIKFIKFRYSTVLYHSTVQYCTVGLSIFGNMCRNPGL